MRTFLALAIVGVILSGTLIAQQRATPDPPGPSPPPGAGEKIGVTVDQGLNTLGDKLRRGWADIRKSVDELGVQGRVYGRLHWDKSIAAAPIEISVQGDNNVTLSGSVPDEAAHMTAVKLAQDTVGVGQVVDHLTVSSPSLTTPSPPVVPKK
ncbi:MAG TPA: BON domain-containing protein [Lacipirellulaceae bacterium]|nr:BON domain-containing protein [Lacipirellulaceae bacterium]